MDFTADDLFKLYDSIPTLENVDTRVFLDKITIYLSHIVDNAYINGVYRTKCSDEELDELIDQVTEFYHSKNKQFHWSVTEKDPSILSQKLQERGFKEAVDAKIMVFELSDEKIRQFKDTFSQFVNPKIEIRRDRYKAMYTKEVIEMIATGFNDPNTDIVRDTTKQQEESEKLGGAIYHQYIAYLKKTIIGWGALMEVEEAEFNMLSGAVTLEEHRKKGVYSAILAKRIEVSKKQGKKAVVITADVNTSAPILERYGFEAAGTIKEYTLSSK